MKNNTQAFTLQERRLPGRTKSNTICKFFKALIINYKQRHRDVLSDIILRKKTTAQSTRKYDTASWKVALFYRKEDFKERES